MGCSCCSSTLRASLVPENAVETQAPGPARRPDSPRPTCCSSAARSRSLETFESPTAHQIDRLYVWTKADLTVPDAVVADGEAMLITSAVTGAGLPELRSAIVAELRSREASEGSLSSTGARCGGSLKRAAAALRSAASMIADQGGDELVAFDLRLAVEELGSVIGAVVTDDILDLIFRRFCIGK